MQRDVGPVCGNGDELRLHEERRSFILSKTKMCGEIEGGSSKEMPHAEFIPHIPLQNGKAIRMLKDACDYALKLPDDIVNRKRGRPRRPAYSRPSIAAEMACGCALNLIQIDPDFAAQVGFQFARCQPVGLVA